MLAIALLANAAALGAVLATTHLRGQRLSLHLAIGHGVFATAGLVAVLLAGMAGSLSASWTLAFGLLLVAALGGSVLLRMHLRGSTLFSPLVVLHAAAALAGFIILFVATLG